MKKREREEKKIYTSFHDIPPRDYMYFPKGTIEVGKPGKFSRTELTHLFISMTVLTFAFAFALSNNNIISGLSSGFNFSEFPYYIGLSFVGIITAFFFHEISHKFMAQRLGLWAEFRMFPQGLFLAIILAIFTPFVFAAPGAVMFRGGSRFHETGQIAMAGPLANITIALITLPLYLTVFYEIEVAGNIVAFVCFINAFLAMFNLLPFGPLDGTKIIRWNATVWIVLFIVAISILVAVVNNTPMMF